MNKQKVKLGVKTVSEILKKVFQGNDTPKTENSIVCTISTSLFRMLLEAFESDEAFEVASDDDCIEISDISNEFIRSMYDGLETFDIECTLTGIITYSNIPREFDEKLVYIVSVLNDMEYDPNPDTKVYVSCELAYTEEIFEVGTILNDVDPLADIPQEIILIPKEMIDACRKRGCSLIVPGISSCGDPVLAKLNFI